MSLLWLPRLLFCSPSLQGSIWLVSALSINSPPSLASGWLVELLRSWVVKFPSPACLGLFVRNALALFLLLFFSLWSLFCFDMKRHKEFTIADCCGVALRKNGRNGTYA
ncbi:hypothetical protein P8452_17374 [Trifolium repens]|nr:hypothetical protein P8452_17374 [Trifolium repens]